MIIDVNYDSSVSSAPSGFRAAIGAAIQFLENTFTNLITITISVGYGEINGQPLSGGALGESETFFDNLTYTQVRSALVQNAHSADQISAVNTLPVSDPTGGGNYWVSTAEAKALGLIASNSATDGYVGFSSSLPFDYDDSDGVSPGTYDFYGTFVHEVTEVMGRVLFVGTDGIGPNAYTPLDLFHYSSPGVRTFSGTTTGYFSLNGGTTNLDNFNTNPNGDFGDWASSAGHDSFLAFSSSGVVNAVTQTDLRMMNVLGYNETVTSVLPNPGAFWHVIGAGDFNADGDADILWQGADGTPAIWMMNGTSITWGSPLPNPGTFWHVIGTGDFNGDGHADILWQGADGTPAIWMMNGSSIAAWGNPLPNLGPSWHVIGTGDFNGDGHSDILWQNNDGTPAIWLMNGSSIISSGNSLPNPGTFWHVIGTGDFNGDGKADILWQGADGTPAIWMMNGSSIAAWGNPLPNPGTFWHVIGTGDFNGDGKADILWQGADGTPAIWLMNGSSIAAWGNPLPNPGTSWHVIGTGDYNGDGHSDILWQNSDGTPSIWFMNGSSIIASSNSLPSVESAAQIKSDNPISVDTTAINGAYLAAPQPTLFSGSEPASAQKTNTIFGATT